MADQLGFQAVGATVRFSFTTHAGTGAPVAPNSGFENSDLRIYKDGSATQRSSASGITMTSPFDTVTGGHHVDIDLSDNTDAGFYADGSFYEVWLVPDETVDSLAVVKVLAYFRIGVQPANVTQWLSTAAQGASGRPQVDLELWLGSAPNALISGRPDVSIGNTQNGVNGLVRSGTAQSVGASQIVVDAGAAFLDNSLIGATVVITNGTAAGSRSVVTANVESTDTLTLGNGWTGATPTGTPTFDIFASAAGGAPADSSGVTTLLSRLTSTRAGYLDNLSAGAVALEASLQALITTIGASAAGVATAVWGAATRLLTAGTNIVLAKDTGVTGFNDLSAAQVNAEADTALSDVGVTTTVTGRIDAAITTRATPAQVATELGTYDAPTSAEMDARTLPAANYATAANLATVDSLIDSILALLDDPRAEPGQGAPAVNADLATKIDYLYAWTRNRKSNDGSLNRFYADDGTTVNWKQTTTEAAGTVTKGEIETGP